MASISVPIEKHKHYGYLNDPFGPSSGGYGRAGDPGPPYIVKLLHIPVGADNAFIEDLFQSRFTSYVKFKIVVDPSSNILESHVIKKVAFVELTSFAELSKVLKWQDLFYKGGRRVVVERADFGDFQYCMQFNQEHEREIHQIQQKHISERSANRREHFEHGPRGDAGPPLRHPQAGAVQKINPFGAARRASLDNAPPLIKPQPPAEPPQPPKPKANPFGAAKPVDIIAKEHEHLKELELKQKLAAERKAAESHQGHRRDSTSNTAPRRPSVNLLKRPSLLENDASATTKAEVKSSSTKTDAVVEIKLKMVPKIAERKNPDFIPAAIPDSLTDQGKGKSLADILSSKPDAVSSPIHGRNTPTPKSVSAPKPIAPKSVILKKKATPVLATVEPVLSDAVLPRLDQENVEPSKPVSETAATEQKVLEEKKSEVTSLETKKESRNASEHPRRERRQDRPPSNSKQHNQVDRDTRSDIPRLNITQPNRASLGSADRPDFKKHLSEITKKLAHKEPRTSRNGNKNGNRRNNHDTTPTEKEVDAVEEKKGRANNLDQTQAGSTEEGPKKSSSEEKPPMRTSRRSIAKERSDGKGARTPKDGTPVKDFENSKSRKVSEGTTELGSTRSKKASEPKAVATEISNDDTSLEMKNSKKEFSALENSTAVLNNEETGANGRGKGSRGRGRGRGELSRGGSTRGPRARGGARGGRGPGNYNLHYVRDKSGDGGPKNTPDAVASPKNASAKPPAVLHETSA